MGCSSEYDFLSLIGSDLNRIKNFFKKGLEKYNIRFDDDIFSDTMLKCAEKFNKTGFDKNIAMQYFWISFKNNSLKINQRHKWRYESMDDMSKYYSIPNETYDNRTDIVYDIVMDYVSSDFNPEICNLWKMHVTQGYTYEDLEKMTEINNLHYQFRKIRDSIRTKLPDINPEFKKIIKEMFKI